MPYPTGFKPSRTRALKSSESHYANRCRKSTAWVSDRSVVDKNNSQDMTPRQNFPWWKSPMMKANRLKAAALRK